MPSFPLSTGKFIVSIFPRGTTLSHTGLIELDVARRKIRSSLVIDAADFMSDPVTGQPPCIRQVRGIAAHDQYVFASAFNAINVYTLESRKDSLGLRLTDRLTHPCLCDVHGVHVGAGRLCAASTGSDAVVCWDIKRLRDPTVFSLGSDDVNINLNFPERLSQIHDSPNWRLVVQNTLHLNDVCISGDRLYVTGLQNVLRINLQDGRRDVLFSDPNVLLHDAILYQGKLLFTDAAAGDVVALNEEKAVVTRYHVVDPELWFLRGITNSGGTLWTLCSCLVENRQLDIRAMRSDICTEDFKCSFQLLRFDIDSKSVTDRMEFTTNKFPFGSVVYKIIRAPRYIEARNTLRRERRRAV